MQCRVWFRSSGIESRATNQNLQFQKSDRPTLPQSHLFAILDKIDRRYQEINLTTEFKLHYDEVLSSFALIVILEMSQLAPLLYGDRGTGPRGGEDHHGSCPGVRGRHRRRGDPWRVHQCAMPDVGAVLRSPDWARR